MRKSSFFILGALLSFTCFYKAEKTQVVSADAKEKIVYVGGMSAGFTLNSGEVQVVGLCEVMSENGIHSPALQAGLRSGDKITLVNGVKVETVIELNEILDKTHGKTLNFSIFRGSEELKIQIKPIKDKITGKYKIGILARDSVSGIGTVTYIDKENGRFGALGHSVVREDKQELKISNGIVYECNIVGVSKGVRGRAGELRGMFLSDKTLGTAEKLSSCGIFGCVSEDFPLNDLLKTTATSESVCPGKAIIYSTINGLEQQPYEIEIVKVDKRNKENKNFVIKITDDKLIEETGGIVQGMSGSPIVQNGKLVGAVTHVFLNDPTRGYGIDIQTMLAE